MNKSELIKLVSQKSNISLRKARIVLNTILDTIDAEIKGNSSFKLLNFGRWYLNTKSSRRSYNIATRKVEILPARRVIAFTPSKGLLWEQADSEQEAKVYLKPTSILSPLPESEKEKRLPTKSINIQRTEPIKIHQTGIKIDSGSPNFGKRVKQPQTEETGDLQYCGQTSYYDCDRSDTESYSFPVWMIPFGDTPILDYRINRFATGGVMEPVLLEALNQITLIEPKIQILQNTSIPVKNRTYGYKPDIAIIWRDKNIFIDIEIDEPYDLISRKPIHFKGSSDNLRNAYFLDNGWNVIRFTEKQIVDFLPKAVEYVKYCIYMLSEDVRFKAEQTIDKIDRWSHSEALSWAKSGYRESYLGIEKVETSDYLADENTNGLEYTGLTSSINKGTKFIKPAEDIISDRYDEIRESITSECLNGKYIIFSLKYKYYDYVALSSRISFLQKDNIYGIKLFDIIEEINIFLRFQEIASFRSVNSIIKYQTTDNDNWEKLLYDVILNSNPIEIEYDTASRGYPLTRTILFVTFWYNFFDDSDNKIKFSVLQLLKVAALYKYQTLAEKTRIGYICGFCNYRKDLRTFNIDRIKGGRIFNCHKNLYKISVSDIWKMLEKGYADIAISMYNELQEYEKKSLFHLGNYANALVMHGKHDDAIMIYKSIPANVTMPHSAKTWKEACLGDFDFFISNNIHKDEFEKIRTTMKNLGW